MEFSFSDRVAVVTGAAHGFGRAICDQLARRGALVWACDQLDAELAETARLCREAGGRCEVRRVDVTDEQAVAAFVGEATAASNRIDILVNNAGGVVGQVGQPVEEVGAADWEAIVRVNLTAVFFLVRAVAPAMKRRRYGAMWRIEEPSLTLGSRGIVSLEVTVRGPRSDLHSGRHGGGVRNPLQALAVLLAGLHDAAGRVAVAGFYDAVREPSDEDRRRIAALGFDEERYRRQVGVPNLYGEAGYATLERQWLRPTLEVNGLHGGYQGAGGKTMIPALAHAKVSCRLVPDQRPDEVLRALTAHLEGHAPPGTVVEVRPLPGGAPAYRVDPGHEGLRIARQVLRRQSGRDPAQVLMGGTLPVSDTFRRVLGISTIYFSFATADEDFHAPNEFFRLERLWDGLAAWAAYWRLAGEGVQA